MTEIPEQGETPPVSSAQKPRHKSARRSLLWIISLFSLCLAVAGAGLLYLDFWSRHPGPANTDQIVLIPKGSGLAQIAESIEHAGLISNRHIFMALTASRHQQRLLKAGEYAFSRYVSPNGILDALIHGRVVQHNITVAEGLSVQQIITQLQANPILEGNVGSLPPEGSMMPDTYTVLRGDDRQLLLDRMSNQMKLFMASEWPKRAANLPFIDMRQAVILASIVERETAISTERPRVAGVYINRLRMNMPLQADPTVIYGLSNGKGVLGRPLLRADLKIANPYNTYINPGLPPGPIANPGRASILAVLHPEQHRYVYFVASGDGGHVFSENYQQHLRAVERARLRQ